MMYKMIKVTIMLNYTYCTSLILIGIDSMMVEYHKWNKCCVCACMHACVHV